MALERARLSRLATPIPSQVADALVGQRFNTFADLRASIWKTVANNPELNSAFDPRNLGNMEAGYSPFVPTEFQIGASDAGSRFHLHHEIPIEKGGAVYDLANIRILDPSTRHWISYRTSKPLVGATIVERSGRDQLISLVETVSRPQGTGVPSEEVTLMLFRFCANCPDPVGAMRLMEDMTSRTAEQLVDFALAMPARDLRDVSTSELLPSHPLRHMRLDG